MPFERPSIHTIVDRIEKGIEARLFNKVSLLRNAILRILARVFAGAIHGAYGYLEWLSLQLFEYTAETEFLNYHGLKWGIARKSGSFATGTVQFTGINGVLIPEDTRIQDEDGIEYGTLTDVTTAGGIASVAVQAIEAGEDGNYVRPNPPTSIYLQMITPISGIDNEVLVDGDITGGVDEEDDEDYRARILLKIQQTPAGGSKTDYERWALAYAGVGRAWCYPLANGPGTVVTVITADGDDPVPSPTLLSDVEIYIEDLKPVTADHTVESITDSNNNPGKALIDLDIRIKPFTTDLQNDIITNIRALLAPHTPGTDVLISQIRSAISSTGVDDYRIDSIDLDSVPQSVDDITLVGYQYPWLNDIIFTELI